MEDVRLILGDDNDFNAHVQSALPCYGDMKIITKDKGDRDGSPEAVVTFTVVLPDGSRRQAQSVTTVHALNNALSGIKDRYGENSRSRW